MSISASEQLLQKYGRCEPDQARAAATTTTAPEPAEPEEAWQQSPAAVKLSDFLKSYPNQGIKIRRTRDCYPIIAIGRPDPNAPRINRDDFIEYAIHLFQEARPDLETFINSGDLTVPAYGWLTKEDFI